jgi:hypothetical protein
VQPERGQAKRIVRTVGKLRHGTTEAAGAIYVELPKGIIRVTRRVDADALRAVLLEELLG